MKNDEDIGSEDREINGDKATGITVRQYLEKDRRGDISGDTCMTRRKQPCENVE